MENDITKDLNKGMTSEDRILQAITEFRGEMNSFREEMYSFREEVNARFSTLETRVATVERKIDGLGAKHEVLNNRLDRLEEKVDERMHETQPIWEAVLVRLTSIEKNIEEINREMRILVADFFKVRARVEKLEDERLMA